jgi:hypothetical protein
VKVAEVLRAFKKLGSVEILEPSALSIALYAQL